TQGLHDLELGACAGTGVPGAHGLQPPPRRRQRVAAGLPNLRSSDVRCHGIPPSRRNGYGITIAMGAERSLSAGFEFPETCSRAHKHQTPCRTAYPARVNILLVDDDQSLVRVLRMGL